MAVFVCHCTVIAIVVLRLIDLLTTLPAQSMHLTEISITEHVIWWCLVGCGFGLVYLGRGRVGA